MNGSAPRRPALVIAVITAMVLALGLAIQGSLGASWSTSVRGPLSFGDALLISTLVFGTWVPFALVVAARARPLPIGRNRRRLAVGLWIVGSLTLAATHVMVSEALVYAASAARALPVASLSRSLSAAFRLHFHESLFLTLTTVACVLAVREFESARSSETSLARAREELTVAQLNLLRYQLQPHFLFNALNSISAEVYSDPARADRMICSLSSFLRHSLDPGDDTQVTLAEELELTQRYLEVEQFRFERRLVYRVEVDPQLLDVMVPPLLLQPLVENSVRHGVARTMEPVTIVVQARVSGAAMVLLIEDDAQPLGRGGEAHAGTGLGLINSRRRLAQLYGEAASLRAGRRQPRGFSVEVRMPQLRAMEAAPANLPMPVLQGEIA